MKPDTRQGTPQATGQEQDNPLASAQLPPALPRWLSVHQIRQMQRCRREAVIDAMHRGDLPYEQRGRIRYARLTDVIAWEERRLAGERSVVKGLVHPDLEDLA